MRDETGRVIDYLRISVTDKCNLRCQYCMPKGGICKVPHEELLRLEEVALVVKAMTKLGLTKVRLTGGEPLVRKNLEKLVADINQMEEIREISLTTNGILFPKMGDGLKKAGLSGVNISLDTLDPSKFAEITGKEELSQVLSAIDHALLLGLRVKVNSVLCREFFIDEKGISLKENILQLAKLAKEKGIDVRFIELMPIGQGALFHGITPEEILPLLEAAYGKAVPVTQKVGNGPAYYYAFPGFKGKIGFISAVSHTFCSSCNRVRLTGTGRLKLCLHYDTGLELAPLLRSGISLEELTEILREEIKKKPLSHNFGQTIEQVQDRDKRNMFEIGG